MEVGVILDYVIVEHLAVRVNQVGGGQHDAKTRESGPSACTMVRHEANARERVTKNIFCILNSHQLVTIVVNITVVKTILKIQTLWCHHLAPDMLSKILRFNIPSNFNSSHHSSQSSRCPTVVFEDSTPPCSVSSLVDVIPAVNGSLDCLSLPFTPRSQV